MESILSCSHFMFYFILIYSLICVGTTDMVNNGFPDTGDVFDAINHFRNRLLRGDLCAISPYDLYFPQPVFYKDSDYGNVEPFFPVNNPFYSVGQTRNKKLVKEINYVHLGGLFMSKQPEKVLSSLVRRARFQSGDVFDWSSLSRASLNVDLSSELYELLLLIEDDLCVHVQSSISGGSPYISNVVYSESLSELYRIAFEHSHCLHRNGIPVQFPHFLTIDPTNEDIMKSIVLRSWSLIRNQAPFQVATHTSRSPGKTYPFDHRPNCALYLEDFSEALESSRVQYIMRPFPGLKIHRPTVLFVKPAFSTHRSLFDGLWLETLSPLLREYEVGFRRVLGKFEVCIQQGTADDILNNDDVVRSLSSVSLVPSEALSVIETKDDYVAPPLSSIILNSQKMPTATLSSRLGAASISSLSGQGSSSMFPPNYDNEDEYLREHDYDISNILNLDQDSSNYINNPGEKNSILSGNLNQPVLNKRYRESQFFSCGMSPFIESLRGGSRVKSSKFYLFNSYLPSPFGPPFDSVTFPIGNPSDKVYWDENSFSAWKEALMSRAVRSMFRAESNILRKAVITEFAQITREVLAFETFTRSTSADIAEANVNRRELWPGSHRIGGGTLSRVVMHNYLPKDDQLMPLIGQVIYEAYLDSLVPSHIPPSAFWNKISSLVSSVVFRSTNNIKSERMNSISPKVEAVSPSIIADSTAALQVLKRICYTRRVHHKTSLLPCDIAVGLDSKELIIVSTPFTPLDGIRTIKDPTVSDVDDTIKIPRSFDKQNSRLKLPPPSWRSQILFQSSLKDRMEPSKTPIRSCLDSSETPLSTDAPTEVVQQLWRLSIPSLCPVGFQPLDLVTDPYAALTDMHLISFRLGVFPDPAKLAVTIYSNMGDTHSFTTNFLTALESPHKKAMFILLFILIVGLPLASLAVVLITKLRAVSKLKKEANRREKEMKRVFDARARQASFFALRGYIDEDGEDDQDDPNSDTNHNDMYGKHSMYKASSHGLSVFNLATDGADSLNFESQGDDESLSGKENAQDDES